MVDGARPGCQARLVSCGWGQLAFQVAQALFDGLQQQKDLADGLLHGKRTSSPAPDDLLQSISAHNALFLVCLFQQHGNVLNRPNYERSLSSCAHLFCIF